MENFASLLAGFQVALAPENIGVCLLGTVLGLVVGAMPGIGSLAGCALLLPLTYSFPSADTAIIALLAVYVGGMYGGSISAITLNTPGTNSAIATTFDGYPMARKGRASRALGLLIDLGEQLLGAVHQLLSAGLDLLYLTVGHLIHRRLVDRFL